MRSFGIVVGGASLLLAALSGWRQQDSVAKVLTVFGVLLLLAGFAVPGRLRGVHRAWMALAHAISRVTTPVFMAIVYFGLLTPIALAMRLLGRSPLRVRRDAATFWHPRPPGARRSDLRRQF